MQVGQGRGVLVERCRYLEQSGCASICINSCKVPTQVRTRAKCYANLGDDGVVMMLLLVFCTLTVLRVLMHTEQ